MAKRFWPKAKKVFKLSKESHRGLCRTKKGIKKFWRIFTLTIIVITAVLSLIYF